MVNFARIGPGDVPGLFEPDLALRTEIAPADTARLGAPRRPSKVAVRTVRGAGLIRFPCGKWARILESVLRMIPVNAVLPIHSDSLAQ